MDKEKRLGMLFSSLADELNISETLYERAVTSYTALGDYIKKNNSSWDVEMFPQGSFELGTVIKPINDEDQYDVDLVILVRVPKFKDPHKLRETIQSFLESHGRYEGKIEEKKQCLRVVYSENSQFHMDVVCATETNYYSDKIINVAKKNEEDDGCNFSPSNPKGYISWFKRAMNYERLLQEAKMQRGKVFNSTKVEELTLSKMRTPLQQAIQILKRHRDIYFEKDLDNRPSSIIITTLCALRYDNAKIYNSESNNVYTTIRDMLDNFYLFLGTDSKGEYKLSNPSYEPENFLYKWNTNEKLKDNFIKWIMQARKDIIENPLEFIDTEPTKLNEMMCNNFGSKSATSGLKKYGVALGLLNSKGELNVDKQTMSTTLSKNSTTIKPKPNTFYGENDAKGKKI